MTALPFSTLEDCSIAIFRLIYQATAWSDFALGAISCFYQVRVFRPRLGNQVSRRYGFRLGAIRALYLDPRRRKVGDMAIIIVSIDDEHML